MSPFIFELADDAKAAAQDAVAINVRLMSQSADVPVRDRRRLAVVTTEVQQVLQPTWAAQGQVLALEVSDEDSLAPSLTVKNLALSSAMQAANEISVQVEEAIGINYMTPVNASNKEAAFLTQSGALSTSGGSTVLWSAGLTGSGMLVGVGDTGLDYGHCFFNDPIYPVTFASTYISELSRNINTYDSNYHRKIKRSAFNFG